MSDEILSKPIDANPKLDTATTEKDKLNVSPTGTTMMGQIFAKIGLVVVLIAGSVLTLPTAGIAIPPLVLTICTLVTTLGVALGIASPGVRKTTETP